VIETKTAAEIQRPARLAVTLPVSVIVPARNEARNLPRCLASLAPVGEIYVVDSGSTDDTVRIAESYGATVVQFHYRGGWPKKRQWAMDTLPLSYDWILLLDADEVLTPELCAEIQSAIQSPDVDGYHIALEMYFLGRRLRHSGASFSKLSLFRKGCGQYECRLRDQNTSMADMEVHEHVIVDGPTRHLRHPLVHHNGESLDRYIQKHNEYSNWEAYVWLDGAKTGNGQGVQLQPSLWGAQAQRRRWLRRRFLELPGSPILFFLYKYFARLGFLDGVPGLIYCVFQGVQFFHIKAKIYELRAARKVA
jgi:glycosyltransferase involved in cell wall biosynthesis